MFHRVYHSYDPVASSAASDASSEARRATTAVQTLESDVERLLMITEALWTILKEQHGYDDAKLQQVVEAIDFRDGKLDGRVAANPAKKCPKCQRGLNKKHQRCLYCGERVEQALFER